MLRFCFSIFLLFFAIRTAGAQSIIDLSKTCVGSACQNRVWFGTEGFQPEFLTEGEKSTGKWIELKAFPIWIKNHFPVNKDFQTYTLLTYFDAPDYAGKPGMTGIRFGEIGEVFEVYINGCLIAKEGKIRDGHVELHRTIRGTVRPVYGSCLNAKNNLLVVKLSGDPRYDHTGFYLTRGYEFGFFEELMNKREDRIGWILISIYLVVGLYHLLLFVKRRKETYNLFFGAFCSLLFVYLMTRTDIVFELPWDTILIQRVELCVLYVLVPLLFGFLDSLLIERLSIFTLIFSLFSTVLSVISVFVPPHLLDPVLRIWQLAAFPVIMPYIIYRPLRAALKKNHDGTRLLIGVILLVFGAGFDVVDSLVLNTGITLTKYVFTAFVLGIAVILANRFLRVHNQVEELNTELEKKVEIRTSELRKSLDETRALKEQQDGDYFLTSLLIRPLGQNKAFSETIKVEFLTDQKKKFKFRHWSAEIGGDLNICHSIKLRGRPFTVFVNGDAMGKSIQGAGGALVLGVVFNSVVARAKSRSSREKYPEQWLKECFIELQNIFVSFDGSMLVSVFLGLIDDTNGFLYYINAEHPLPVLFQNGEARFVGRGTQLRKIGVQDIDNSLVIQTTLLEPGAALIAGSDGRDDLMIGEDSEGNRILNEDENIFLRNVESGKGDLATIEAKIQETGVITDDLSLLKVIYRENEKAETYQPDPAFFAEKEEALRALRSQDFQRSAAHFEKAVNLYPLSHETIRNAVFAYYFNGMFEKTAEHCERAHWLFPEDTDLIYWTALALKKAGKLRLAADHGERVRLRRPDLSSNLLNLAEIYYRMKLKNRSDMMIREATENSGRNLSLPSSLEGPDPFSLDQEMKTAMSITLENV